MSFEEALGELEQIAETLEEGELGLDDSIAEFERGTKLVRLCQDKLEEAERKIEILQKGEGNEPAGGKKRKGIQRKNVKIDEDTGEIDEKEDLQGSLL